MKEGNLKAVGGSGRAGKLDPVCGRRLASNEAAHSEEYKKRRYFFCSAQCQKAFVKQTERFRVSELARAGALMRPGGIRWATA